MRSLLLFAILFGASCDDSSLQVRLEVPDNYKGVVSSAALSVVVPPAGAPFTCDDIAFGNVTEDFVRANTVEELILREEGSGGLDSIPREGTKLFWARAYNDVGEQIIAGCTEHEAISGKVSLEIIGEPVTVVVLPALTPTEVPGRTTEVRITDALGMPASDIEVRWTQTSSGNEGQDDKANSDSNGLLKVVVSQLNYPGPVAIDLHAKWARGETPVLSGFLNPQPAFMGDLPNSETIDQRNLTPIYQSGRLGPMGEMGFAALSNGNAEGRRKVVIVHYDTSTSAFVSETTANLPAGVNNLALAIGPTQDKVMAIGQLGLTEVFADGTTDFQAFASPIAPIRSVFTLADCEGTSEFQPFLVVSNTGKRTAVDVNAQAIESPFASAEVAGLPIASGCLSIGGKLVRSMVFAENDLTTLLSVVEGVTRTVELGVIPAGVGFTQLPEDTEALLLATTLSVSGTDIARFRLLPVAKDALTAELLTSDATPSFSQSTDSGDLDGDGRVDIAAVVSVFGSSDDPTYRIYISLGLESNGNRVVGVSGQHRGERPRVFVRDFNQDGIDDILAGTAASFSVFLMGPIDR